MKKNCSNVNAQCKERERNMAMFSQGIGESPSTKYARQSTKGDPHNGRLIRGMHEIKNKMAIET